MDKDNIIEWIYNLSQEDPRHESGEVLGSMTTPPPPEAIKVVVHFISKNLGDPTLFKSLQQITDKLIEETRRLLSLPENLKGIITSGGTESNILALYTFREALGIREVLHTDLAHYSISKAAKLLNLKEITFPTDASGKGQAFELKKNNIEKTGIVLTMGTTELGSVEDPRELIDENSDIPIHIDAAFGGFTFPFIDRSNYSRIINWLNSRNFAFTLSVDFHKFLGAPIPSGIIFLPEELFKTLSFDVEYILSGKQFGLLGTRPGFSSPAALATLAYYGEDGIASMSNRAYNDALWFLSEAERMKVGKAVNRPDVPIACLSTDEEIDARKLIEELAELKLYVYRGAKCRGIRTVVMPHVTRKHLEELLKGIERAIQREKK
ncbi:MAG: aminotransferase class V-fold PLP-dependent enzyme [Fervidicoccaceae archaeon]